jgi:hypothetical protein
MDRYNMKKEIVRGNNRYSMHRMIIKHKDRKVN